MGRKYPESGAGLGMRGDRRQSWGSKALADWSLDQPRTYAKHASASPPAELVVDDRARDDDRGGLPHEPHQRMARRR